MKHLVLIGLMGAGKTTVGRKCAEHLGRDFVDTDDVVVALAGGIAVEEIFATYGESRFRELERQAVADVCASPAPLVIACGGGVAVDPENRKQLNQSGTVVWLRAPVAVLAARVGDGANRPLLAGNPASALSRLEAAREAAYDAAADERTNTEDRTIEEVVNDVIALFDPHAHVHVPLGERSYTIWIANDYHGLWLHAEDYRRVAFVTDTNVEAAWGAKVRELFDDVEHETFVIDAGEDAKTMATVEDLCRRFTRWGLRRGDLVVAVGGGVVGDTAGFAAAVHYRGVDVAQVPTTLLAMVDSAIGGKTGVNLPEGKNLIGAFHQPVGVFVNPSVLATLPEREYKCGLGEIAKYALMEGFGVDAPALLARDPEALTDVIAKSAAIKARYVAADEFETTGVRAVLNYGHTLAHALETATDHALLHGEAVAIGLVFAGQLAGALERIDPAAVAHHEDVVASLRLPVQAPAGLRADELLAIMARDKKSGGGLTFVLAGPSGIERVDDPDLAAVRKAFAAVGVEG